MPAPVLQEPCDYAILLVEDDPDIQDALRQILEEEGFHVYCASNGAEAIRLLPQIPRPRVALIDLMMPVMNGWELVKQLKQSATLCQIPVVAVSAVNERDKPPGVDAFIRKPINVDKLIDIVRCQCDHPS
jgi:two-component system, OmpR family, response regulator CpxR